MSEHTHATSVGQTGGLPGDNASYETRLPTDDDLALASPPAGADSTTTVDSHDEGTGAEGDAYDEPDSAETSPSAIPE